MKKIIILFCLLLLTGCQLQINLASSVVNVPVNKAQYAEKDSENKMSGSDIKNPKNDQTTDTVVTP